MSNPFSLHYQSHGYPGRSERNQEKAFNKGQAFGTIDSVGNYSDRTRIYIVQLKQGATRSKVKAKALGIEGSGIIERYKPGDRVLLAYPNNGRADQPIIVGRYSETTGYSLAGDKVESGLDRSNLPNNPPFNARPDSLIISTPSSFEYINSDESGISFSAPRTEDNLAKNDKKAGNSSQSESEISNQAEKNLKQAKDNLYISERHILGSKEYRYSAKPSALDTHRALNNESAKLSIVKAELDLDEADEERRRQEEMNKCLEKRNEEMEEGLENLKLKVGASALATINSFLPPIAQVGVEVDEEGNITGVSLGPINVNTKTGKVSVEGQEDFVYGAANAGLSVINQSLPPYLQLCMGKNGILEVGDYGRFDIESILEGEGDFDIGPFSMRKECRIVQTGPGSSEEVCESQVSLNDSVYGLVNNALDDLNQNLPEPLQLGFDKDNNVFSLGPIDLDLDSGDISLDKASLSRTINRLSKQFLPPPAQISVSSDFEAVSLGPVTYNSEDKSVSVLGETIYIDEGKCKKDKAQNQTPLSETPDENKQRDSADKDVLPTIPPLGQETGGSGRFKPTCRNSGFLSSYFDYALSSNSRDPFRLDTFLKRFGENLLASGNYGVERIGLESGIFPHDGYDQLYGPNRRGGYNGTSFPTLDLDDDSLFYYGDNGAIDLATILAQYGVEESGLIAQAVYDYFIEGSVFGLIDFTKGVGNRHAKVVSYSIQSDLGIVDSPEIISYSLGCNGASDLINEINLNRDDPNIERRIEESAPSTEEFLSFPLSLLEWAEEIDPQNRSVYEFLSQGAVVDAMTELIFQQTGRNIDALGSEYESLRYAVARATHGCFRGHDIQEQISIRDLDESEISDLSPPVFNDGENNIEPFLTQLQIQDSPDHIEFKDGDVVVLSGTVSSNVQTLRILGVGALKPQTIEVNSTEFTIEARIEANNVFSPTLSSERIRVSTSSEGQTFDLLDFGITPFLLNDTRPRLSDYTLTYPEGRNQLKLEETADLSLVGEDYDRINFESATLSVSESGSNYEISIKDTSIQESEALLLVRLVKESNGSSTEAFIPVALDFIQLSLSSVSNNTIRLELDPITIPIDITFSKPVSNVEMVNTMPVGSSEYFEGSNEIWRHYISLSLNDIGESNIVSYRIRFTDLNGVSKEDQVSLEVIGFIPYRVTIDTSQTRQLTIPEAILTTFPGFKLQWISENITFTQVESFSGNPFEYRNIDSEQIEIAESFREQYVNGETELIISPIENNNG